MDTGNSLDSQAIFFDGVCNLCNGAVDFVLKRDKKGVFKFASLQSDVANDIIPDDLKEVDSIILYKSDGHFLTKSDAAIEIGRQLRGLWPIIIIFKIFPRPIRDWFYSKIAKNRYKWFGKRDTCRMPTPDIKERFLES